jgi:(2Fe-2S) ferredoxin
MVKPLFSQIHPGPQGGLWKLRGRQAEDGIRRLYSGIIRIKEDRRLPAFERHVFVCHNVRPADAPRPSCTSDGKSDLHTRLQQLTKEAGLAGRVRINKSGCLDQCEHGPTVVVYPEAVWYGKVRPEDADAIVQEHLVGGRPVERLRLADECLNTKTCPHRS